MKKVIIGSVVLGALLASAVSFSEPQLSYGYGAPYGPQMMYGPGMMYGGPMMGGMGMMYGPQRMYGYGQGMMYGQGQAYGPGMMQSFSMFRHRYAMQNGVDPKYAYATNPLRPTTETLKEGARLFAQDCSACHGATGLGNGPAAKGLNPPPADIAALIHMPMESDGYLYWTIAEGGTALGTAMPPFKGTLKDDQIWKLITYLRTL